MSKKNNNIDDMAFKIMAIGSSDSGKNEIIKKLISVKFDAKSISTVGFGTFNKEIKLRNGYAMKLNIIDTAGIENFKSLWISYIKNADGFLFIFSHNDKTSFDDIKRWLVNIKKEFPNIDFKNIKPAFLVGNYSNLEHEIDKDEIEELRSEYNFCGYIDINSNDNDDYSINLLFSEIGEIFLKIYGKRRTKQK